MTDQQKKTLNDIEKKQLAKHYSRTVSGNNIKGIEVGVTDFEEVGYLEEVPFIYETEVPEADGTNYLHLTQVVVNAGGKIYLINCDGLTELQGESTGRGASLFIQYERELGDVFEEQIQFHKGFLLTELKELGRDVHPIENGRINDEELVFDKDESVPEIAVKRKDIWRD